MLIQKPELSESQNRVSARACESLNDRPPSHPGNSPCNSLSPRLGTDPPDAQDSVETPRAHLPHTIARAEQSFLARITPVGSLVCKHPHQSPPGNESQPLDRTPRHWQSRQWYVGSFHRGRPRTQEFVSQIPYSWPPSSRCSRRAWRCSWSCR